MVRFYFRHANGIGVLERVTVGFDERKINLEEFDTGEDRIYTKRYWLSRIRMNMLQSKYPLLKGLLPMRLFIPLKSG